MSDMDTNNVQGQRVFLGAEVEPALKDAIVALADREDRTLSAEIRRALREYVDRHAAAA